MKRLVYSPTIYAFVSTPTGVVDVSPYVVRGSVNRKVNQVSSAQLTLRNPVAVRQDTNSGQVPGKMLWTEYLHPDGTYGPRFHPQDPIIIVLQRLDGFPIQVFTGYLDKTPYLQLYPGLCTLEASCTLKRLKYTLWDSALPFTRYFLEQFGWVLDKDSGIVNPTADQKTITTQAGKFQGQFNDGSIGALLFAVLTTIGDWDTSTIWIEALPPEVQQLVLSLYQGISSEAQQGSDLFKTLLHKILGSLPQGTGAPGAPGAAGTGTPGAPTSGSGQAFSVQASQESTDLTKNSGWGCGAQSGDPALILNGYSELQNTGSLGGLPCGFLMYIASSTKAVRARKVDSGGGSGFNPVIGLYPAVSSALFNTSNGGSFTVTIWAANGQALSPASGATPTSIPQGLPVTIIN